MEAIILAAGHGTRMGPLVTKVPKPMLPVAGRPLLAHTLQAASDAGITRATVVVHHLAQAIIDGVEAPDGLVVRFVDQGTPKGTGHAVAAAGVDDDALLLMGDAWTSEADIRRLLAVDGFAVGAAEVSDPWRYGVLEVQGRNVTALHEKPHDPPTNLINTGMYRLPADAVQAAGRLASGPRGEIEFTDVVRGRLDASVTWVAMEDWLDVGAPWDLLRLHEQVFETALANGLAPAPCDGGGKLLVEDGATIKGTPYVEGTVLVQAGASVGPMSFLRGPIVVGPGAKIGAFTEVKNSILLAGAKAPHHNYVGDSILGHDVNLGSGTKLANLRFDKGNVPVDWEGARIDSGRRKFGAIIGDGAQTGINASLAPGTIVAAGATVSSGASVRGWIT